MAVFRHMESIDLDTLSPSQRKHFRKLKRESDKEDMKYHVALERFSKLTPIYCMIRIVSPFTHLGAKAKAEQIYADLQKMVPKKPKGVSGGYVSAPSYAGLGAYAEAAKSIFPTKAEKSAKVKRRVGKSILGMGCNLSGRRAR